LASFLTIEIHKQAIKCRWAGEREQRGSDRRILT